MEKVYSATTIEAFLAANLAWCRPALIGRGHWGPLASTVGPRKLDSSSLQTGSVETDARKAANVGRDYDACHVARGGRKEASSITT